MNSRPTLADLISDLADPTTTGETIVRYQQTTKGWGKVHLRHLVQHPSLLDQLRATTSTSTISLGETFRPVFASKPSARLDALAALARIDGESLDWARHVGTRTRVKLEDRLRGLAPHSHASVTIPAAAGGRPRKRTLHGAAQSWLTLARVVTGWENAPFAPDVPCPNTECERRGTLRIRFDQVRPSGAACIECGTTWEQADLPGLGAYVRWAAEHLAGPRHDVVDEPTGLMVPCGDCADVREQMAERRRLRGRGQPGMAVAG